jgi:3'(2'), 5'-bisphosphate nucleotidase
MGRNYSIEKEIAIESVMQAARLCQQVRAEMVQLDSLEKGDRSPVTVADFGAQALVCRALTAAFPGDAIVAEEDSTDLQQRPDHLQRVIDYVGRFQPAPKGSAAQTVCRWIDAGNGVVADRFWTLDPIDGTKGFLRNDQYAIALALVKAGEVQVAALACPALPLDFDTPDSPIGVIFVAVRGQGTHMAPLGADDFVAVHVARSAEQNTLRFVESVEAGHGDHTRQQAVAKATGINQPSLRMDSQAKYGAVARGDAALYLRLPSPKSPGYREKIWDHAAGMLVVTEAGGMVTDMHGRLLDLASGPKMTNNRGVVVSNGQIHPAVIQTLQQTG